MKGVFAYEVRNSRACSLSVAQLAQTACPTWHMEGYLPHCCHSAIADLELSVETPAGTDGASSIHSIPGFRCHLDCEQSLASPQ